MKGGFVELMRAKYTINTDSFQLSFINADSMWVREHTHAGQQRRIIEGYGHRTVFPKADTDSFLFSFRLVTVMIRAAFCHRNQISGRQSGLHMVQ